MKPHLLFFACASAVIVACHGGTDRPVQDTLADAWEVFSTPQDSCRTKVWWFHGETETTREGITADLEAFRRAGVGGVVYYDQVHAGSPDALDAFSPQWWEMLKFSAREADRLGLSFEINLSNGYVSGGPWITDSLGMQRLLSADTLISGGRRVSLELPEPDRKTWWDVATVAFPAENADMQEYSDWTENGKVLNMVTDGAVTVRSISYSTKPSGKYRGGAMNEPGPPAEEFYSPSFIKRPPVGTLEASTDGKDYFKVCDLPPYYGSPSGGWRQKTVAFPEVTASYFRITADGDVSQPRLSSAARMNNWEERASLFCEYVTVNDTPDYGADFSVEPGSILDLSGKVTGGRLDWDAPEGDWYIMRFYMTPTGAKTKHGRPNLIGLESDKLSAEATEVQWDSYAGRIIDTLSSIGLKPDGVCMDSHEAGPQNWSWNFPEEFERRRGYSIMDWLPVMSGFIVEDKEKTDAVLLDLRKTISECIADNYFSTLQSLADEAGVEFTAQAMGNGQSIAVDNIAVKGRMRKPQGEFWAKHKHGSYDIKEASSAAHIYGRPIASAEAYTDMNYGQTLAEMKNLADFAYANQLNEFVVCASAYQPWAGRIPGNTAGGRQYCLNRNNPYWEYSRGFWDYQARCAAMMRLGRPENALCIYLGDNPPLKLQTYRLPEIPPGYEFDVCSADGLLGQTFARNGMLCTKSGMEYGMLVIEDKAELPEDVRAHIEKLRHGGVPVCFGKNLAEALDSAGVPPTVIEDSDHRIDSKIYFAHRILADADMFFINNHSARAYDGRIAVRSGYSHACWWNPVDGSRKLLEASADGGYVSVDMLLQPGESGFIVTSDRMPEGLATREYRPDESVSRIEGPWSIFFDPDLGGCGTIVSDTLFDWSEHGDPRIRFYSGTAVYESSFTAAATEGRRLLLRFPHLESMAEVAINGRTAGTVWCSPWELDISDFVREGGNSLTIRVTNSLANRIIGDYGKPAEQRITWATTPIFGPDEPLRESGIIGEIQLITQN